MFKNISFIGGIHGVGKTTICTDICGQTNLLYLSASELIRWNQINNDAFNKKVVNILGTQDRLLEGLKHATQVGKHYLLDGHYCLLDANGTITPVPINTFRAMSPVALFVITGNPSEIRSRLEQRDSKRYDEALLATMQEREVQHARAVAELLGVRLAIGSHSEYANITTIIKEVHGL